MADPIQIDELFLTPEDQATLEQMAPAFEIMQKNIDKMKAAGMDVTQIEADFTKGKELREGVLRELTRK